jgi:hypothetical protein
MVGPLTCLPSAAAAADADKRLEVAAGAEEKPGRCLPGPSAAAGRTWTKPAMGGILPPHLCPARCGAWRRYPAWQSRVSAAPAFQSWRRLSLSRAAVSAPAEMRLACKSVFLRMLACQPAVPRHAAHGRGAADARLTGSAREHLKGAGRDAGTGASTELRNCHWKKIKAGTNC